jgi:hypothetical protein
LNQLMSASHTRPLVLYSLVSRNIFTNRSNSDFFMGLLPFFAPFIFDNNGQIFNPDDLIQFASRTLLIPLTRDITDIFTDRLIKAGWLVREAASDKGVVYRCKLTEKMEEQEDYRDVEQQLDRTIDRFQHFAVERNFPADTFSRGEIEEAFLSFLVRNSTGGADTGDQEVYEGKEIDRQRLDYLFGKFISSAADSDPKMFAQIERLAGTSLLSEALMALRDSPSKTPEKSELVAFVDGPLLMDYLGLSGKRMKDNATYILEKLRKIGVALMCFKHTCDEIHDNLLAVLERQPIERVGPTAEALRNGEVTETFAIAVKNNPEHFVRNFAKIQVAFLTLDQFRHAERYLRNDVFDRLVTVMPAGTQNARRRDAESISIIMRRRGGSFSSEFFKCKFVLLTASSAVAKRATELLREVKALPSERNIIGPAVNYRLVAALLFADFGIEDKVEISRRQLLAGCAKVISLRPNILERIRSQLRQLNKESDLRVLETLISQPRAGEILMDFTMGSPQAISSDNIDEIMKAVRATAATDLKEEYEKKISNVMERVSELERSLESTRENMQLGNDALIRANSELEAILERTAYRSVGFARFVEISLIAIFSFVLLTGAIYPAIYPTSALSLTLSIFWACVGALGTLALIFNKQLDILEHVFNKIAAWKYNRSVARLGVYNDSNAIKFDYRNRIFERYMSH